MSPRTFVISILYLEISTPYGIYLHTVLGGRDNLNEWKPNDSKLPVILRGRLQTTQNELHFSLIDRYEFISGRLKL